MSNALPRRQAALLAELEELDRSFHDTTLHYNERVSPKIELGRYAEYSLRTAVALEAKGLVVIGEAHGGAVFCWLPGYSPIDHSFR